jgi:hypothetical protein
VARIVKMTDAEFWEALDGFTSPRQVFDAQGQAHADIDFRLVELIDGVVAPAIGDWERSQRWWHQMDFYGDGIRSLIFAAADFQPGFVPALQRLLVGEHADFCILCQVMPSLDARNGSRIGSIAIRSNGLLISYPLVEFLRGQV